MSHETYRQQLVHLVRAMCVPNCESDVSADLSGTSAASRVKMFVDGNLEKRFEKVQKQLEFVAEGFDQFDDLIVEYIRACPSAAYDSGASDGERMLVWLTETCAPTDEQLDYIECQRARHTIEDLARKNRLKHVRFQELYSLTEQYAEELSANRQLRVYLNPIRTWAQFISSALLDDETLPPANVLFFPVRDEITTAVLELEGQALINELSDYQPCTLDEWAALSSQTDRDELVEMCHDLADMGLVAFG